MVSVRSNALCGLCSGKSAEYFFNKKVLVNQDVCSRVLIACKETYSGLVQFFDGSTSIASDLAQASRSNFSSSQVQSFLKESEKIHDEIIKKGIVKLISNHIAEPNNVLAQKAVCEKFVCIHETSLLTKIQEYVQKTQTILNKLLGITTKKSKENEKNNYPVEQTSLKRLLESVNLNETLFFTGDVVMVTPNIDSSYTAHLGATGANGNELSHRMALPINITSLFP